MAGDILRGIRAPFGALDVGRYSDPDVMAKARREAGILGPIDSNSSIGGLIPVPPATGKDGDNWFQDALAPGSAGSGAARPFRALTEVDLAPASAPWLEKIGADLRAPSRWSPSDHAVTLSDEMRQKADAIAREFHDKTGKELVVTSGSRTPADQARAMYVKFRLGDKTYTGPSGREIKAIYDNAIAAGQSREVALESMTAKIREQLANGRPVSRHLLKEGLDFRTNGMKEAEVKILQEAMRRNGGITLYEGKPPHLHASFPPKPR